MKLMFGYGGYIKMNDKIKMSKQEREEIIDDIIRMLKDMGEMSRKENQGVIPDSPAVFSNAGI